MPRAEAKGRLTGRGKCRGTGLAWFKDCLTADIRRRFYLVCIKNKKGFSVSPSSFKVAYSI